MKTRHEDQKARFFVDSIELGTYAVVSWDDESDVQTESNRYMGSQVAVKDSTLNGYRITAEIELPSGASDPSEVFDRFVKAVRDRTSGGKVRIVYLYRLPGETSQKGNRYDDVHLNMRRSSREGQPLRITLTGEAADRQPVQ